MYAMFYGIQSLGLMLMLSNFSSFFIGVLNIWKEIHHISFQVANIAYRSGYHHWGAVRRLRLGFKWMVWKWP